MASGSNISLGIEVNGEQTFKTAIAAIDAQLKGLDAGMKAAAAEMDTMGKSEETAAQKMSMLGQTLDANQKKMNLLAQQYQAAQAKLEQLGKALDAAKASGDPAAIDRATNAYNRQSAEVSKLSAQMSKTQAAITKTNAEMQRTGEEAKKANNPVAALLEKLKGISAGDIATGLGKAAKGFADFSAAAVEAGKAVVGAMTDGAKKVYDMTASVGQYADTLLTLSSTSNVDLIDLQKWQYASQFIDTSVETLTGSLSKLTKNMTSETAATSEAFARLGVSVKDSNGNYRDAEDVMFDVVDALGQVSNQTERDALAMTLLGKSASDLNPLIQAGSKAFKDLGTEAEQAGLIMDTSTVEAFGKLDDEVNRMKSTFAAAGNGIAAAFLPAVQQIVQGTTEVVQAFVGMVNGTAGAREKFASAVSNLVNRALTLLNEMLPRVLEIGGQLIQSMVSGIMANLAQITNTIKTVITNLISTITANLPAVITAGVEILVAVISGIVEAIPQLVEATPQIIAAVVNGLAKLAPKLLEAGVNIIKGIWQGIASAAQWLGQQITGMFGNIVNSVKRFFGIHSPSTLMADQVGRPIGLGVAEGILSTGGLIQRAMDSVMPSVGNLAAGADTYSVTARAVDSDGGNSIYNDTRPIILTLNDRELGRAVRGYVYA